MDASARIHLAELTYLEKILSRITQQDSSKPKQQVPPGGEIKLAMGSATEWLGVANAYA
jgi:hypothetical protein